MISVFVLFVVVINDKTLQQHINHSPIVHRYRQFWTLPVSFCERGMVHRKLGLCRCDQNGLSRQKMRNTYWLFFFISLLESTVDVHMFGVSMQQLCAGGQQGGKKREKWAIEKEDKERQKSQ